MMDILELFKKEFKGDIAFEILSDLSRFHRIQVSDDYDRAAEFLAEKLENKGIKTRIVKIPTDENLKHWGIVGSKSWWIREGFLYLTEPEERKLADISSSMFHIIQRSSPIEGEFEVVLFEDRKRDLEKDFAGKFILTDNLFPAIYIAAFYGGAKGIIYYGGRLKDALTYTSFWWHGDEPRKVAGFVITPEEGEKLRKQIKKGKKLKVKAKIDSGFKDGNFTVVEATIEGKTDEEFILIAHLCHPKGEANDNLSGVSVLYELATLLKRLIDGKLNPPERTIKFLFVPEIYGTTAYLSKEGIPNAIGGLNLDMVGQDLKTNEGILLIDSMPLPTFSPLLYHLERIKNKTIGSAKMWGICREVPLLNTETVPFTGGSDHMVLSSSDVGIPAPMLIQWPDRYYHTSKDTPDKISIDSLKRTGIIAGTYAYTVANINREEAGKLLELSVIKLKKEIITYLEENGTTNLESLKTKVKFKLSGINRFAKKFSLNSDKIEREIREFFERETKEKLKLKLKKGGSVFRKLVKGPFYPGQFMGLLKRDELIKYWEEFRKYKKKKNLLFDITHLLNYMDGRRTLNELLQLSEWETGCRPARDLLELHINFLERAGLVESL